MSTIVRSMATAVLIVAASVATAEAAAACTARRGKTPARYPSKPVRIIVGSAPGGGADFTARTVAQKLTEAWGRSVIVENRSGTALYALEATANATADGYTTGMGTFNAYLLAVLSAKSALQPDQGYRAGHAVHVAGISAGRSSVDSGCFAEGPGRIREEQARQA